KYVAISYTIADDQGNVVEQHDLPIGFVYGSDTELIGGMDKAIAGKTVGDQLEVKLAPEEAFGQHDPELTFTDDLENVPPQFRHLGAEVQMQNEAGETKTFYISRIEDGKVTVDGNHPLAGKTLTVRVKILEVRDAQPGEERTSGIHAARAPGSTAIN
ncbi:MAG TPA: peptidylprolyl isomerase, partial [Chromatiaceae bacterium]|nr:peptidylprolyl isomerase [Chromatiaceae bacterium]